jgi:signal transduction histidine kinase/CheY-like chemotaxis protein
MKSPGLRLRIFLATTAVIAGSLVLTYAVVRSLVERILEGEIVGQLARAARASESVSEARNKMLVDQARSIAQVPHLRAVLDTPDVDSVTIDYTMRSLEDAIDVPLLFICDESGRVLADSFGAHGDAVPTTTDRRAGGRRLRSRRVRRPLVPRRHEPGHDRRHRARARRSRRAAGRPRGGAAARHRTRRHADARTGRARRAWQAGEPDGEGSLPQDRMAAWASDGSVRAPRTSVGERDYMATVVPFVEPELRLVLSRPLDELEQQFHRVRQELLAIGLALAGVGLFVSQRMASRIARPIRTLTRAADALARGELDTRVEVGSRDEVGVLARSFNDMGRQLAALMAEALEKARAAERANEAKSIFLGTMTHEIRTPLNGVLGFAEQLRATRLDAEQAGYLEMIQQSGRDLLALIDEILDFARLDTGVMRLEEREFAVASCISRSVDAVRATLDSKGLALAVHVAADVPPVVSGPESKFRQVLTHYLDNAVKFTARGSITVRVTRSAAADDEVRIRVAVADTGIGLDAKLAERLFQPFVQLDAGSNRTYGGSGLGLAICSELVKLMDGEVGVESEPGAGSTFWFTARVRTGAVARAEPAAALPSARRETEAPATWPPDDEARRRRSSQRVLVAEDNPINQRMVEVVLKKAGWQYEIAQNGTRAVELFQQRAFDVVLMDCRMPVMDGLEATRAIRALTNGKDVPIVAFTANEFDSDREACLSAGMDDFLSKPCAAAVIVARLDHWLAARTAGVERGRG